MDHPSVFLWCGPAAAIPDEAAGPVVSARSTDVDVQLDKPSDDETALVKTPSATPANAA
jgi:hypothetical protein